MCDYHDYSQHILGWLKLVTLKLEWWFLQMRLPSFSLKTAFISRACDILYSHWYELWFRIDVMFGLPSAHYQILISTREKKHLVCDNKTVIVTLFTNYGYDIVFSFWKTDMFSNRLMPIAIIYGCLHYILYIIHYIWDLYLGSGFWYISPGWVVAPCRVGWRGWTPRWRALAERWTLWPKRGREVHEWTLWPKRGREVHMNTLAWQKGERYT